MSKVYKRVGSLNPRRSVFNLSYEKKFTCDMGQLIPVMHDEVVPGDIFKIGNQAVIRFQPLVAPVLHEVNVYVHYFFVPYRIIWDSWEEFITGGVDGDDTTSLPYWHPTSYGIGTLWDYFGFPPSIDPGLGARPVCFPMYAYNKIFNDYYRDANFLDEIALTTETIEYRCWEKDYFTSALLNQQRGTAPALPVTITGTGSAVWEASHFYNGAPAAAAGFPTIASSDVLQVNNAQAATNAFDMFNSNIVDFEDATATTFDIADLRLAFQIQKWMERNNRAGVRYTEFLKAHFGVSPRDDRLQRPEYIGGSKAPVIFSEVLQTSETGATTAQGNLAGHGIAVSDQYCGTYRVNEYGLIMGIMSVMPKPVYQSGVPKQWIKSNRYDFYFPEFANLSEQAIVNMEVCAVDAQPTHNNEIFGYQGRYDELRTKQNMVCSLMRTDFDYWHISRQFNPANPPVLNPYFTACVPRKDIYAVPSEPGLIVSFGNIIKAIRPIPIMAEPGLIDHN